MYELGVPPTDEETREITIQRLKQEIDILSKKQSEARKRAAYGGMTPEDTNKYDSRQGEFSLLTKTLLLLTAHNNATV
jgi:hypothetical protein